MLRKKIPEADILKGLGMFIKAFPDVLRLKQFNDTLVLRKNTHAKLKDERKKASSNKVSKAKPKPAMKK